MHSVVSKIVPVIDLKSNQVVHAIAGERDSYRPIRSRLTESSTPIDIAQAFADLGFRNIYVADLDAIAGAEPDWIAYEAIAASGLKLWVDNGIQKVAIARQLRDLGHRVIVGLEAIHSLKKIDEITSAIEAENMIVSIDMRSGQLITNVPEWSELSPNDVALQLSQMGVGEFILLDLTHVGTEAGISRRMTELVRSVRHASPNTRIYSGGGVKFESDVLGMIEAGCDAVLVSTALHNQTISL